MPASSQSMCKTRAKFWRVWLRYSCPVFSPRPFACKVKMWFVCKLATPAPRTPMVNAMEIIKGNIAC